MSIKHLENLSSLIKLTKLKKDEKHKLYIPDQKTNQKRTNDDFEIYLSEESEKGGLMLGKAINISGRRTTTYSTKIWPYFVKFTRENIPIPLQQDEYVEFISCGYQHLILATNHSKCYLFGDFNCSSDREKGFHFGTNLPFKFKETVSELSCKITHLDCGERFVIIKDEFNRFWFAGKTGFNYSYEFLQLDGGELDEDLNKFTKITKVVSGGNHVAICVDDKIIYTIGNNYNSQLGFGRNSNRIVKYSEDVFDIKGFSFVKCEWNLNNEYQVKELVCSGNSTAILTKCGKLFKTMQTKDKAMCSFQLINPISATMEVLTLGSQWSNVICLANDGNIYKIGDNDTDLQRDDFKKDLFFIKQNLNKLKLSQGTTTTYLGCHTENEVRISRQNGVVSLKTNLPVSHVKISGQIMLIFCLKKQLNYLQSNLFKVDGLFDIVLKF
ncbi:hypothetical protein ABK040_015472 [Willaertia magna]